MGRLPSEWKGPVTYAQGVNGGLMKLAEPARGDKRCGVVCVGVLHCLLALSVSATDLRGQEWEGEAFLRGTVGTTAGEPIAGATVELRPIGDPVTGPPPTTTNADGAWRHVRLTPGRYEIHIRARGFINVNGWATVPPQGVADPIHVEMLPLSWGTPSFSSGSPHTMLLWIEKGNSLLEQGHPAPAREVYERALAQLPRSRQPEVLRSIARTYYLEGAGDRAADVVRQALEIAPTDATSRQLFTLLMEGLGRSEEASVFLAELAARPVVPVEPTSESVIPLEIETPQDVVALLEAPPEIPEPHRVGSFKTFFTETSPWRGLEDYARRMGISVDDLRAEDPEAGDQPLSEESFQVVVPDSYRPEEAWGLLVWISPTPFGGTRRPEMAEALAHHRLIWIGANHAGNERPVWHRIWLALDAAFNMQRLYAIDPQQVFVAGYSGGGRAASRIGVLYPEVVHGAWSLYGCDYFRAIPLVERPGASWPAKYPPPPAATLDRVKGRNRFVLVTGLRDFNFTQTRSMALQMRQDGFAHVTYLEIPDADHYTFPDADWLDRIFQALKGDTAN